MLTWAFLMMYPSTWSGRENNGCSDEWGRQIYRLKFTETWWALTSQPMNVGTDLHGKVMASIEHHRQMEGTSMEKWTKDRAHDTRPSMNFLQLMQHPCGFWKTPSCYKKCRQITILNANLLGSHQTEALNVGGDWPLWPVRMGHLWFMLCLTA
jgi:hypothetical protein